MTPEERLASLKERGIPALKEASLEDWQNWRWQLKARIRHPQDLGLKGLEKVIQAYPLLVTPYYLSLIRDWQGDDPIKIQALPDQRELEDFGLEDPDPLAEERLSPVAGLIHRYPDRVLILTTNHCATYCRHCNRKRLWRRPLELTSDQFKGVLTYISSHPEIREVILSGGDPLLLPSRRLETILASLRRIPHIEVIRIGTRIPVTLPMRVDSELLKVLKKYRPLWILTHFNHPREITAEAALACQKLLEAGLPVLNQTVLLKGVNDSETIMKDLFRGLTRMAVKPYYLFQCDPVLGVGHLRTSVFTGLKIIKALRGYLGGIAIPTFVVDLPGGRGKVPLEPDYLLAKKGNKLTFENFRGEKVVYQDPDSKE